MANNNEDAPKDAGKSQTRSGEDVVKHEGKEPGRKDAGTQGKTERPVGTSTARDATGIDPQDPDDK